jgi:hypothetical protein
MLEHLMDLFQLNTKMYLTRWGKKKRTRRVSANYKGLPRQQSKYQRHKMVEGYYCCTPPIVYVVLLSETPSLISQLVSQPIYLVD